MIIRMSYRSISLFSLIFLILLMAAFSMVNPTEAGSYIRCPVNKYLGLKCPGCGSLRAIHSFMHGDLIAALRFNLLSVLMLPILISSMVIGVIYGEDRLFANKHAKPYISLFLVVLVLFTVLRNII